MTSHLLSWITFTPLLGAFLLLCIPKRAHNSIRWIALATTAITAALVGLAFSLFRASEAGFQLVERAVWIPQFGVQYLLGMDGISFPMVVLTALISLMACLGSLTHIRVKGGREKEYYFLFLLLETGMMGTFLALDLFLFYIFWEVVLVPMYFLIGIWGGPRKEYAAIKFFLYTLAGSLFMLIGIVAVYFASSPHTFDMTLLTTMKYGLLFQKVVFLAFFLGFAIKVPVFPFHTWLPDAHVEAPTPISVILAGVLLKMGTYGFLRFSYPLFPDAARWFQPAMGVLAVVGIIYGGFIALAQTDFKKMVAYSSVSHMGFVLLGLAAMNADGFRGALLQMFNHGTITGGLFLLVGVLYDRAHTRDLNDFGGLGAKMPVYAGILTFFSLASLGLPGLSGFISEFLSLLGAYQYSKLITALSAIGILLAAAYLLYMIQRVLLGKLNPKWAALPDMNALELSTLVPLMVFIVAIGLYPKIILEYMIPTLDGLLGTIRGGI
ncbi:MAG TPA: NADH-quinone oxidoreductase subunit M [Candidatus Omnitrophota bacterium]|jgi:NADH-quinone oxidoreductase subunit M|nr:MAG: NADH-quinone oxidoreductase subunit M [Candidatus Omnitrophica bacterium ADurb.Bin314]HQB93965.1 NADH-quinone oxidoreductase subunit M [Candidatus Omnitrophota bacterium]